MAELNPYEKFLDGRPVETILAATPDAIATQLDKIGPAKSTSAPAPGKWSPAEIICHLADCEIAFGFRLRQTLAEKDHIIQPFNQDKWAAPYPGIPAQKALAAFTALRNWNLFSLRARCPTRDQKL